MIRKLSLSFLIIAALASCALPTQQVGAPGGAKGGVSFGIGQGARAAVIPPSEDVDAVVVTITDSSGNVIHDMLKITLYDLGGGNYLSESIQFDPGSYRLTKFLVVDADNNILYAAPLAGSALANLVNTPLPMDFSVQEGHTTSLPVQVVETAGTTPADFGYITFSFEVVADDGNLLRNGGFDSGASSWNCFVNNNGEASMEIIDGTAKVTITNPGENFWDVGLGQTRLNLEADCTYELSFSAKASVPTTINALFQYEGVPWTNYELKPFNIDTTMITYSFAFTMDYDSNPQAGFNFQLGSKGTNEIYLDNICLRKIAEPQKSASSGLFRGLNVGNALDAPMEGEWDEVLDESYFQMIKDTGFDHVRIPVRWSTHALYETPYTIDQTFFDRVDWAINSTLSRGMTAIIDMHHYQELFGTQPEDSPVYPPEVVLGPENNKDRFLAMWTQIADHYKNYPDTLYFEILNEPNTDLTPELWNQYLLEAYAIIRATNPTRKIVIDTANWGNRSGLDSLEIPANDKNIIVTFHYTEPFHFCFQGAEWVDGSDAWLGTSWEGTEEQKRKIRHDFDDAVQWAKNHGDVPIWIGEFNVMKAAEQASRIRWTTYLARQAEKRGIGWTYWGFCSNESGIYDDTSGTWDTDIVNSLIPSE
jgi:endoglucanase